MLEQTKSNILFIEKDFAVFTEFADVFMSSGCNIQFVKNGTDAITSFQNCLFDLILINWNLTEINGHKTLLWLDKMLNKELAHVPYVLYKKNTPTKLNLPKTNKLYCIEQINTADQLSHVELQIKNILTKT